MPASLSECEVAGCNSSLQSVTTASEVCPDALSVFLSLDDELCIGAALEFLGWASKREDVLGARDAAIAPASAIVSAEPSVSAEQRPRTPGADEREDDCSAQNTMMRSPSFKRAGPQHYEEARAVKQKIGRGTSSLVVRVPLRGR